MADTRCANPEYQLEVDEMIVDYFLYRTVESHLDLITLQIDALSNGDGLPSSSPLMARKKQEAVKLHGDLEKYLKLFDLHHPTVPFSGSLNFNITLVRFVVYLSMYIPRGTRTHLHGENDWQHPTVLNSLRQAYQVSNAFSPDTIQDSQRQRVILTVLRRNWLDIRHASQQLDEGADIDDSDEVGARKRQKCDGQGSTNKMDMDDFTESSERMSELALQPTSSAHASSDDSKKRRPLAPSNLVAQQSSNLYALTLFELTRPFMELSLHISRAMGNINNQWMELAAELMLQSGIERLQEISGALVTAEHEDDKTRTSTNYLKDLNLGLGSWINECFAWGSIKRPSSASTTQLHHECVSQNSPISYEQLGSYLLLEDLICAMFNSSVDITFDDEKIFDILDKTSSDDAEKHEYNHYTGLRERYLEKLQSISINSQANRNHHYVPALKELCRQFPAVPFLRKVHTFTRQVWQYNMSKSISGKPALVQIEQGGLHDLSGTEFNEFLERCGLKMSRGDDNGEGASHVRWA